MVERDFQEAPPAALDKHKVLQIVVNLIRNANHALVDKTLHFSVRVRQVRDATKVELEHRHAHSPDHQH